MCLYVANVIEPGTNVDHAAFCYEKYGCILLYSIICTHKIYIHTALDAGTSPIAVVIKAWL